MYLCRKNLIKLTLLPNSWSHSLSDLSYFSNLLEPHFRQQTLDIKLGQDNNIIKNTKKMHSYYLSGPKKKKKGLSLMRALSQSVCVCSKIATLKSSRAKSRRWLHINICSADRELLIFFIARICRWMTAYFFNQQQVKKIHIQSPLSKNSKSANKYATLYTYIYIKQ